MNNEAPNTASSEQILSEAAATVAELYDTPLTEIRARRVVVGVFFTGVLLSNGSGGVAYTPPDSIQRASTRILKDVMPRYRGLRASELISPQLVGPFAPVIRLATLNALSAPLLVSDRYRMSESGDLSAFRQLFTGRRVCMVGAIVPLLKRLQQLDPAEVAIIDRKEETQQAFRGGRFVKLEDTARELAACQTAVFTGASIANGTLETLLSYVAPDAATAVVGPTSGFVPEPLFRRGVSLVGTAVVTEPQEAMDILAEGGGAYQLFGRCIRKINLANPQRLTLPDASR